MVMASAVADPRQLWQVMMEHGAMAFCNRRLWLMREYAGYSSFMSTIDAFATALITEIQWSDDDWNVQTSNAESASWSAASKMRPISTNFHYYMQ